MVYCEMDFNKHSEQKVADIIENILKGQYKKENETIEFSCAYVELEVPTGTSADGSYTLYASEGVVTEGRSIHLMHGWNV